MTEGILYSGNKLHGPSGGSRRGSGRPRRVARLARRRRPCTGRCRGSRRLGARVDADHGDVVGLQIAETDDLDNGLLNGAPSQLADEAGHCARTIGERDQPRWRSAQPAAAGMQARPGRTQDDGQNLQDLHQKDEEQKHLLQVVRERLLPSAHTPGDGHAVAVRSAASHRRAQQERRRRTVARWTESSATSRASSRTMLTLTVMMDWRRAPSRRNSTSPASTSERERATTAARAASAYQEDEGDRAAPRAVDVQAVEEEGEDEHRQKRGV